jgi:hypothetical protein
MDDINRENSWFIHQSSLEILPAESSSSKAERSCKLVKEMMNLALHSIFVYTSKESLTNFCLEMPNICSQMKSLTEYAEEN